SIIAPGGPQITFLGPYKAVPPWYCNLQVGRNRGGTSEVVCKKTEVTPPRLLHNSVNCLTATSVPLQARHREEDCESGTIDSTMDEVDKEIMDRARERVRDDGVLVADVYEKVAKRLRGAVIQLQAMDEDDGMEAAAEEKEAEAAAGGVTGFSKVERFMSGAGVGPTLKGGLIKKHTFQAPAPRKAQGSLLGLDKLAAQKRLEMVEGEGGAGGRAVGGLSFSSKEGDEEDDGDGERDWVPLQAKGRDGQKDSSRQRRYRSRAGPSTPSHPGGVNRAALEKIEEKERSRRKSGGVEVSPAGRDRIRDRDKGSPGDRKRGRDRDSRSRRWDQDRRLGEGGDVDR
ncbi:unnamed protein product, partial [Discosporangium mesarthrocarpum]